MNAYVDESRMTQDVDILSPRAPELGRGTCDYLSERFQIAVRVRTVADGLGHRLYQLRKSKNRHLVDVQSVNGIPPHQVVDNVLVVPPADLIGQKVLSMVSRSGTAKRITDLADIHRLLLTFPDLKAPEGLVADSCAIPHPGPVLDAWRKIAAQRDRRGERRRRILNATERPITSATRAAAMRSDNGIRCACQIGRPRVALAVATLLLVHLTWRSTVCSREPDSEELHLPAGITYWQTGTFRLYHHNPPLVKLIASLPVLAAKPLMQPLYRTAVWNREHPNRMAVAQLFAELNSDRYFELFTPRLVMPLFSMVAALVIFAWSTRLYGASGLIQPRSLVFLPERTGSLPPGHDRRRSRGCRMLATFSFWLYRRPPVAGGRAWRGLAGLAELTKFSLLLLYVLWPLSGAAGLSCEADRGGLGRRVRAA